MTRHLTTTLTLRLVASLFACLVCRLLPAQSAWDAGGSGTNLFWSNPLNWSPDGVPLAGGAVSFSGVGTAASGTTSTVDQSLSIGALSISYSSNTARHVIEIASGSVLTQTGAFSFGGAAAGEAARLTLTGDGSWVINSPAASFTAANSVASRPLELNMAGLANFQATVDSFNVGTGSQQTIATVSLAKASVITANNIRLGGSAATGTLTGSKVLLGQTTTFNATNIVVGTSRTTMGLEFQTGLTGALFTVRGLAGGESRANFVLGSNTSLYGSVTDGSSSPEGLVDLRPGVVDFKVNDFVIGLSQITDLNNGIGYGKGTFSFDEGTVDVTRLMVGRLLNTDTAPILNDGSQKDALHATFNMEGGTLLAGTISIAQNEDGAVGVNGNSRGILNISGGQATITGDVVMGSHSAADPSVGYSNATANLTGGTVVVEGNIAEGTTGNNVSTLNLGGAVLDMTGGFINVDTFNAASGTLMNVSEINGGAGLTKTGSAGDVLVLEGVNTYTGGTTVAGGRLEVGSGGTTGNLGAGNVALASGAVLAFNRSDIVTIDNVITGNFGGIEQMGPGRTILTGANTYRGITTVRSGILQASVAGAVEQSRRIVVEDGAAFYFVTGSGGALNLTQIWAEPNLELQDGSTIGMELGGTISSGGQSAVTSGTVTLHLFGNSTLANPAGSFTLLQAANGLSDANYELLLYGVTNFSATLNAKTASAISVTVATVAELDEAWWLGGQVSGHGNEWAVSNGSSSNWASNEAGTAAAVVPGAGTDVFLSATGGDASDMVLGGDLTIGTLTVSSSAAAMLQASTVNTLTIAGDNAITLLSGAGTTTLNARIALAGGAPVFRVDSSNPLVLGGVLEGSNGYTKTGEGVLRLTGAEANTITGLVQVDEGTLELGKTAGVDAITGDLGIGGAGQVKLVSSNQIADGAGVNISTGGVLDLNGQSEAFTSLTGSGLVTNSATAATSVLTLAGTADPGALFTGSLQDGAGPAVLALVKTGAGTQVLGGAGTYSGGTTINEGVLRQAVSEALGTGSVTVNGPAAVWDLNGFSEAVGGLTVDGGGQVIGAGSIVTSASTYQMISGAVSANLAGASGLSKTGDGTVVLSGDNTYSGLTTLTGNGVLSLTSSTALGATGASNGTFLAGDAQNAVRLELSNNITIADDLTLGARQGATAAAAALSNVSGDNTWAGNITFTTGGTYYNVESQTGLFTLAGEVSAGLLTGSRVLRLYGAGDGEISGAIVNAVTVLKEGTGTWTLSGANSFTGPVQINSGTLKIGADQNLAVALQMGSSNGVTTAGTLDLSEASATFTSLVVQTNSAVNTNVVTIGAGQSLNINGNVRIGSDAAAQTTTLLNVAGDGTMNITNAASGALVQLGGYSGAVGGQGNAVLADFRDLAVLNIGLNTANGHVRVSNNTTANSSGTVTFYTAKDATIVANMLTVGGGGQFGGAADQTVAMYLGTGASVLHVDAINIGTGPRDFGKLAFQTGDGTLEVRGANGTGRASLVLGGGSGNTGVDSANNVNVFDVTGHQADLLLGSVAVGTQEYRATYYSNVFSFDQGTLDMTDLTLSTRTTRSNPNGAASLRTTDVEFNLGGGVVNIENGVLAMGVVTEYAGTQDTVKTHIANATMNISGDTLMTIGETGGTAIRMAGAQTINSEGHAAINIGGQAEVTVLGDIVKVGGAGVTTAEITFDGALLDMTGHTIGSTTNEVTFQALSGTLRNLAQLNGGGDLIKTSAGLLVLDGLNTYTGRTMVNAGALLVSRTDNIQGSSGVTVAGGAVFHFGSTDAGNNLVLDSLVLQDGSTIGVSVGNLIDVQGSASATGSITVDIYGVSGLPASTGTYNVDVITSLSGSLNGASYTVGNYYNVTNFTVNSVGSTAGSVFLNVTVTEALAEAWWKGGYGSGLGNVWSVTNGSNLSNWVTDQAGLAGSNTGLVPGAGTKVYFSADGAANQEAMTLGANMGIGSLEFQDSLAAVTLEDYDHVLTLNSQDAISVAGASLPVTLRTTLNLAHAMPEVDVAAGAALELGWIIGGNAWTKTGLGTLALTGDASNTYTGTARVLQGEVTLAKGAGFDAITGMLEIGENGGPGTVRVRLLASDQIHDAAVITLRSNGVLTLNSFNETLGGLEGDGAVENLANGTTSVLTVGGGDVSSVFEGTLRNGGAEPTLEVTKTGTGTLTLAGTGANTYSGVTRVVGGVLALGKTEGVNAVRSDLIVGDGVGEGTVRWLASHQVGSEADVTVNALGVLDLNGFTDSVNSVLLNGGSILGPGILVSATTFDLRSGQASAVLSGTVGVIKSTAAEVILSGQNTYAGTTLISAGTLVLGVDNALPTGTAVTLGEGTSAGKLDLGGFSQTISGLAVNTTVASNVNEIVVSEGETLTVEGNIQVGPSATASNGLNGASTRLNMTGGGSLVVNQAGGTIRVAVASDPNVITQAVLDLSELASFTANLGAAGSVAIGQGDNVASRPSSFYLAQNNDVTAGTVNVGGGASGSIQSLFLGSGSNDFHVNSFNVGTGPRDIGVVEFAGATGAVSISGLTPGTRANFNLATGGANTGGLGTGNVFDVTGHEANLLLNNVVIGSQPRGTTSESTFSFDQGTMDVNTLAMGTRGLNTIANGATSPRDTYVTMNLGGGSIVIQNGISAMARVTGETPVSFDIGKVRLADVTLNLSGDAVMEVKAAGSGTAISMAGAEQAADLDTGSSSEAHARINITGAASLTVRGNIVREGGPGVTSATINLDGGTLDMTGASIGNGTNAVVLNAMGGTLRNLGELNGGATLLKTGLGKTLIIEGTNTHTGLTDVAQGTLWAKSGTALSGTSGLTVRSGAAFHYASGSEGQDLDLAAGAVLTLENNSTIGVELGNLINLNGAASVTGAITVDVFGISGAAYGLSQYDVITATGGLNGAASYTLGNFYGLVDYTVTSIGWDDDTVWLNVSAADVLPVAYWKGGFAGGGSVWAISNATRSNWATDLAGTDTPLVPGATTAVIFSATAATGQEAMTLGADMRVGSIEFNNGAGDPVALDDAEHRLALTQANALTANGIGEVSLNTRLVLEHANAVAHVDQAAGLLSLQGTVEGAGLAKTGAGRLNLEGVQVFTGALTVSEGTMGSTNATTAASMEVAAGAALVAQGTLTTTAGNAMIRGQLVVGDDGVASPTASQLTFSTDGGSLVFDSTSTTYFDLTSGFGSGTLNAGGSDRIEIQGAVTVNAGATLELNVDGMVDYAIGDAWQLFDWAAVTGGVPGSGAFTMGSSFEDLLAGTGYTWDYSDLYIGGTIVVAPEPSRMLLLFGALVAVGMRRRRGGRRCVA